MLDYIFRMVRPDITGAANMSSGEKDGAGKDKGDKEKMESWLRSGAEKPLVLGPETEAMTAL